MHNTYNYYNETNNISQTDNSTTNVDSKPLESFKISSLQSKLTHLDTKSPRKVPLWWWWLIIIRSFPLIRVRIPQTVCEIMSMIAENSASLDTSGVDKMVMLNGEV